MILLQNFFRNGGTYTELKTIYGVDWKFHPVYDNLVLFKYNQIRSPFTSELVKECRGLILDSTDKWKAISFPFKKFFNHNESFAAKIDWSTARTQIKIDGSLLTLYAYNGGWMVSTTNDPSANGRVGQFDFSFAELFWKVFDESKYQLPSVDCNKCFFFELTSPFNKVVVHNKDEKLTLLGGRDMETFKELTPEEASEYFPHDGLPWLPGFPRHMNIPKVFDFKSKQEIVDSFKTFSGLEREGYVAVDANFNRQKFKSPSYLLYHHMKDGFISKRNLLEVVRANEIEAVAFAFPEHKSALIEMQSRLDILVYDLNVSYNMVKHIENQREFAMEANKTKCPSALFQCRNKQVSNVREYLERCHIDVLMSVLDY